MTTREIIEETVAYYKENPFGYDEKRFSCEYQTSKGNRCAVGRCMIPDKIDPLWSKNSVSLAIINVKEPLENILQEKYRGHSLNFWFDLQAFHDDCAMGHISLDQYKEELSMYFND